MIECKCLHVQKGSLLLPAADLDAFESGPREAMYHGAVDTLKVSLHICGSSAFVRLHLPMLGAESRRSCGAGAVCRGLVQGLQRGARPRECSGGAAQVRMGVGEWGVWLAVGAIGATCIQGAT